MENEESGAAEGSFCKPPDVFLDFACAWGFLCVALALWVDVISYEVLVLFCGCVS